MFKTFQFFTASKCKNKNITKTIEPKLFNKFSSSNYKKTNKVRCFLRQRIHLISFCFTSQKVLYSSLVVKVA